MKGNHLSLRRKAYALSAFAAGVVLMSSCAQDGFDDESWHSSVTNTALESPAAEDIKIEASADGSQTVISWPVVHGAGGYHAIVSNLTSETVLVDSIIDGTTVVIPRVADNLYEMQLTVIGDKDKGNTDGQPVTKPFNSFIEALASIPSGTDLNAYFSENPVAAQEGDAVYDLEPGGNYTLTSPLNFSDQSVMLRSIADNAVITCSDGAYFMFGNGIKLQNVNIDVTGNKADGLFVMSDTPSASLSTEALGYKAKGANQDGYVMTNPVNLKNVNVKNLQKSLIYAGGVNWSLTNLIIDGCIIQLDNEDSSNGVINLYGSGGSNGLIKNMAISNSTFYNLKENSKAYFIRYKNSSNAQPQKVFGTDETATLSITHCTFANVFTGKDMANNMANTGLITTTLTDNIFYDVFRVYQFVQTNTVRTTTNNYIWWVKASPQSNDTSRTDSAGNPICTEADPGFTPIEELQPLDFSAVNLGADFTPSGIPADNMAGDPRWLGIE